MATGETFYLWDRVLTDEEIRLLAEANWPSPPYQLVLDLTVLKLEDNEVFRGNR